jgi:hypothetical protein
LKRIEGRLKGLVAGTMERLKVVGKSSLDGGAVIGTYPTAYVDVTNAGYITYGGTAKAKLSMRPAFVAGKVASKGKPTTVELGAYSMYSMPIWNSDDEELFWRLQVPRRWDGASDIHYYLVCALSAAETENDDFAFQLSTAFTTATTGVIASATTDVTVPQNCGAGYTAQYSVFKLDFTIDWDAPTPDMAPKGVLAGRVRRVASGGVEVSNEIYVVDHWLTFTVDKVFGNTS